MPYFSTDVLGRIESLVAQKGRVAPTAGHLLITEFPMLGRENAHAAYESVIGQIQSVQGS